MNQGLVVLIIAHRRFDSLKRILQACTENGVRKIYIFVDGVDVDVDAAATEQERIFQLIRSFEKSFKGELFLAVHSKNHGCAASVLSACSWIFTFEERAIILEDDCEPTLDFFNFCHSSFEVIEKSKEIWLACGTQFVPASYLESSWRLSNYALIWGWATTKTRWIEIEHSIRNFIPSKNSRVSAVENSYWNAGARRAIEGWVDVWDTILVQQMIRLNRFAILPNAPLVTNTGGDKYATHTSARSKGLYLETGSFEFSGLEPRMTVDGENWLRSEWYGIAPRHWLSTKITWLIDHVIRRKPPYAPLTNRWDLAITDRRDGLNVLKGKARN
jgi:hypothetical protein